MISRNARFTVVALLLAGTALFLHARTDGQFIPPRIALSSFPVAVKSWLGADIPIPQGTLKGLGPGEFLQRTYENQETGQPDVDLYVAYLPNRSALYRHLPEDCLVGSGWSPVQSDITTLAFPDDEPFPVNRYLIEKGADRQLVLFWYTSHGRRVAREDWMDWYLVLDSLRMNRSDNALIRMNTQLQPGENQAHAEYRLLSFARLVNPLLKDYIPR